MRFSDTLTGPMLTTAEWLAEHQACVADGETHTVVPTGVGPWRLIICLCRSRHLVHDDEWAGLAAAHRTLPALVRLH